MMYRAATKEDLAQFCAFLSYKGSEDMKGIVAYDENGVAGMVGFDHWTNTSVHAHMMLPNPKCTIGIWKEVKRYLREHGYKVVIGMTPAHIERAIKLLKRGLKWQEVARIKDGWDEGTDIVITEYRL